MDDILFENDGDYERDIQEKKDDKSRISVVEEGIEGRMGMGNICQANPATRFGRFLQLIQMLFLPSLPIVMLIVQDCIQMVRVISLKQDMNNSMTQV